MLPGLRDGHPPFADRLSCRRVLFIMALNETVRGAHQEKNGDRTNIANISIRKYNSLQSCCEHPLEMHCMDTYERGRERENERKKERKKKERKKEKTKEIYVI